jgi:hypothetical protein
MYIYKKSCKYIQSITYEKGHTSLSRHKGCLKKGLISRQYSWLTFSFGMTVKTLNIDCILNRFR